MLTPARCCCLCDYVCPASYLPAAKAFLDWHLEAGGPSPQPWRVITIPTRSQLLSNIVINERTYTSASVLCFMAVTEIQAVYEIMSACKI